MTWEWLLHYVEGDRDFNWIDLLIIKITQCYKKKSCVIEASPVDTGSLGLPEHESVDRFSLSDQDGEIFQLEVWNSSNFVLIFLFLSKSMKKFETYTIGECYLEEHLEFFSEFSVYYSYPGMRFKVDKTWFRNFSFLQNGI